jgi:hypothetical protein
LAITQIYLCVNPRFLQSPHTVVGMSQQNVCFYSNKCVWSKAFLEELSKTPWKDRFRFVCVDPGPTRPQLPAWLKKVPTLVISGEGEPRTDGDVMNWLSEMKMKNGGSQGQGQGPQAADIEGWNTLEHQSFAKGFGYSFNDADTSTGGNGGASIPGTFSFLGGAAAVGDRLSQQIAGLADTKNKSKKEMMFDKSLEDYQKERDRGMPQGNGRL